MRIEMRTNHYWVDDVNFNHEPFELNKEFYMNHYYKKLTDFTIMALSNPCPFNYSQLEGFAKRLRTFLSNHMKKTTTHTKQEEKLHLIAHHIETTSHILKDADLLHPEVEVTQTTFLNDDKRKLINNKKDYTL